MPKIKYVRKRDGRIVKFNQQKVTEAIYKAFKSVGEDDERLAQKISDQVVAVMEVFYKDNKNIPHVEQIQDLVEQILMKAGHTKAAKSFILYRQERAQEREKKASILGKPSETKLSVNALKVLEQRYLIKDEHGNVIENPEEMFRRVAKNIAKADKNYEGFDQKKSEEEFYNMMIDLDFVPNSPTLMNAGTSIQQLSACFVLPVPDSMRGIFEAVRDTALIHQSGGGTGFNFSNLRPKGDMVTSTKGVASGPLSFMKVFDAATDVIKQGGKRRGANMGILRVDHPDIMEFITSKEKEGVLPNFNISVGLTAEFMKAVINDEDYEIKNPRTKEPVQKLSAKSVFDLIVTMAWKNGEPGIVFLDRLEADNPTPQVGKIECTNPCGEQPLLPYEACNLGSINLAKFVKDEEIDWERLKEVVHSAVHFLDNVIDQNNYPLNEIQEMVQANRKIGLGIMGFADMLFQLFIPYNSEACVKVAESVMKFIRDEGMKASEELGKKKGNFPNFKGSVYEKKGMKNLRNATVTTIAPTGTISMIAETSSGIEPLFSIVYTKTVMDDTRLLYVNENFEKALKERDLYSAELTSRIAKSGSIQDFKEIPEDLKKVFVVSKDIEPEWHIRVQAAFQKYTDNAVSKTINFPHEAGIKDIKEAYILSYNLKCKGLTVYRDRSREVQVLSTLDSQSQKKNMTETPSGNVIRTESLPKSVKKKVEKESEKSMDPNVNKVDFKLNGLNESLLKDRFPSKNDIKKSKKCPECGAEVQIAEGCLLCLSCGFSACSV